MPAHYNQGADCIRSAATDAPHGRGTLGAIAATPTGQGAAVDKWWSPSAQTAPWAIWNQVAR